MGLRTWIILDDDEPLGVDPWCDYVDAETYQDAETQAQLKHPNRNIVVEPHDQSNVPPPYEKTRL